MIDIFTKKETKVCMAFAGILSVLYYLLFGHTDCVLISEWAKCLLDCVFSGNIRDYAAFIGENCSRSSNYNVFVNIVNGIWFLPIYALEHITGQVFHNSIDIFWLKTLVFISVILSARSLKRIAKKMDYSDENVTMMVVTYLLCAGVSYGSLGTGQIDAISAVFIMWSFEQLQKKSYVRMTLLASFVLLMKGLGIFIYLPWLLLLFAKDIKELFRHGLILVLPYAVNKILEKTFFIGYALMRSTEEAKWNHIERFFDYKLGDIPLFLTVYLVILIVCAFKSWGGRVKESDYLVMSAVAFGTFIVFMYWSPQWFIYGAWIVIIAAWFMRSQLETFMSLTGLHIGLMIWFFSEYVNSNDNALVLGGILNAFVKGTVFGVPFMYQIRDKVPGYALYIPSISRVIICACIGIIVYNFALTDKHSYSGQSYQGAEDKLWIRAALIAQFLTGFGFVILSYCEYAKYV